MANKKPWVRLGGFLVGLALAGALLLAWRVPTGTGSLGLDLTVSTGPTGELGIDPGPVGSATSMKPGSPGTADQVEILNQTSSELDVSVRAVPSTTQSDDVLMFRLSSGGHEFFEGTLGDLRDWTDDTFGLAPQETGTLTVEAWIPASVAAEDAKGRVEDVFLEYESEVSP